ncbi:PREDICTED: ETS-like protein pointed, isoform P2/D, partial [Diuraphis noxia]|uniref:ETS-like protein pointed, isoform P2/D n=1 Tax=Diuraphis noxia TaxID=143948 RepID=UPI000763A433
MTEALQATFASWEKERHKLNVPKDPRLWTEAQASHWFWWAYREFSVPEPPPTPLLRRVVCGTSQFQKFTTASPNTTIMGRSSQMIRERVRRGRRRLRSSGNCNGGSKSPGSSNNDDDNDTDKDLDDDDDEPYDELVSSSSSNKPLYARRGRHLCNMGRERFVAEAPPFLGDILWEHLEMMQRDIDRASSISMFGGGNQHLTSLHNTGGNNNNSNFYHENFVQHQQHRHQVDDNSGLFSSAYPVPAASEPQHIRLQSPPHRLNHRNRNLHHNQQYET